MRLALDASAAVAHFAYDAGYIVVAKAKGLLLWTRDGAVTNKAPRVAVKVLP